MAGLNDDHLLCVFRRPTGPERAEVMLVEDRLGVLRWWLNRRAE
jgi:hypothetical protein